MRDLKFYATTAIDYVNGKPHIGHAYEKIIADTVVRYKKLCGFGSILLGGTDEHSQNVLMRAEEEGTTPKDYCDEMYEDFKAMWKILNINYDVFMQTSDENHEKFVKSCISKLSRDGYLYKARHKGWYCVSCEKYYKKEELINEKCPYHSNINLQEVEQENYFFKLSEFREKIRDYIMANQQFIQPQSKRVEILKILDKGLEDIIVSRNDTKWGIKIPFDETQTAYVWIDALLSYISPLENYDLMNYWPASLHIVGKDIIQFHCIVLPAILMALELPLPEMVYAHGFINKDGVKMSKTLKNVIYPEEICSEFETDAVRYYFLSTTEKGEDGNYTKEDFIKIYRKDLIENLSSFIQNVIDLINSEYDGVIPEALSKNYDKYKQKNSETIKNYKNHMENLDFKGALNEVFDLIHFTNENYNKNKTDLYPICENLKNISVLMYPFMPETTHKMLRKLGLYNIELITEIEQWGTLKSGNRIRVTSELFLRV